MSRYLPILLCAVACFLTPEQINAQDETEGKASANGAAQVQILMDDDWGWSEWKKWLALERFEETPAIESADGNDEPQAEKPQVNLWIGTVKENNMDAFAENLVNLMLGTAFPGGRIIGDILSDFRFSFKILSPPGFLDRR